VVHPPPPLPQFAGSLTWHVPPAMQPVQHDPLWQTPPVHAVPSQQAV